MDKKIVLIFLSVISDVLMYTKDYTGYEVIRIFYTNEREEAIVRDLLDDKSLRLHIWSEVEEDSIDVQVRPAARSQVTSTLSRHDVRYRVDIADIQAEIDRETKEEIEAEAKHNLHKRLLARSAPFRSEEEKASQTFHNLTIVGEYVKQPKMLEWLSAAKTLYPHLVTTQKIGRSTEGRPMLVVKIGDVTKTKPIIYIDANIHAREWVTSATAIYIINKLVTEYGKDVDVTMLVDHYNWYILPVANPDGFAFSHSDNRMWRKTRSRVTDMFDCYGVDPNRNWDFHWMDCCRYNPKMTCRSVRDKYGCASHHPCADVYGGPRPFSEPETRAMADFLLKVKGDVRMYLSLHCYSQLWLTPWGYTRQSPKNGAELDRVAAIGSKALHAAHNMTYTIGSPAHILYAAAGGSYDWAKGVAGIKYSYTMELRDKGQHGFLLPMDQIIPTAEESWAAIQAVTTELMKLPKKDTPPA